MSSWIGDWERALMPMVNGAKAKERTRCKLGRHLILQGVPAVWLKTPMGLSCFDCAEPVAPEEVALERARLAAPKVPAARGVRPIRHGTAGAYTNRGCRCVPCTAANTAAADARRRRRRERKAVPA